MAESNGTNGHARVPTKAEFQAQFRGRMLLLMTEAWAARKAPPSELGALVDAHALAVKGLLGEMYDALRPAPAMPPVTPLPKREGAKT